MIALWTAEAFRSGILVGGIRFATDLPVWLVLAAAIGLGVAVMLLYLRESRDVGSPWSFLLPAMRGTAVVLACLLLAGPVWHHRQIIGSPARVIWAVDRSASMGESDSSASTGPQAAPNRLRRVSDLLFGVEERDGWIEKLAETHWMDVVLFDRNSQTVWDSGLQDAAPETSPQPASAQAEGPGRRDFAATLDDSTRKLLESPDGPVTDLTSPLRLAADQTASDDPASTVTDDEAVAVDDRERLGGVGNPAGDSQSLAAKVLVLFSDGRDSVGSGDATEMAAQLRRSGWQIHTIGVGSIEESPDLAVIAIDAPERVADDGRLAGAVTIKHIGYPGQSAWVHIRSGDTVVWSKRIEIPDKNKNSGQREAEGESSVPFEFPVESLMKRATADDLRGVDRENVVLSLTADVRLGSDEGQVDSGTPAAAPDSAASDSAAPDSAAPDSAAPDSAAPDSAANSLAGEGEVAGGVVVQADGVATVAGGLVNKMGNDSLDFRVAAASRDRRLLILDGSSRWEMRYLRNLLNRDPSWQVDTILFGSGTDRAQVTRGVKSGELPNSSRAWSRYDAVVLGEIPPDQWTSQDADGLAEFVSGGGGLIVIDGRYERVVELISTAGEGPPEPNREISETDFSGESTATPPTVTMAGLVPVAYRSGEADLAVTSADIASGKFESVQSIAPTDVGRIQTVMSLDSAAKDAEAVWSRLPAPTFVSRVTPQADAEVWGEALDEAGNRSPWLVTRLYGAGRVFYLASDQTWRWRYKLESQLHSRFWNQLLTAAMQPPYAVRDEFVAIGTDKIDYAIGQSATIRAALLREPGVSFGPSADGTSTGGGSAGGGADETLPPTVDALLLKDDQIVATLPMRLEDAARRTYIGRTDGLPAGQYRVRVRVSGFDASALKASTPIWVVPPRGSELDRVSVDEAALQRIASSGGGVYVHESAAGEILASIAPLSRGRIVESDTLLWQTWWVFLIIVILLALEWWFRKKVGLA